jgi:hypothetical protein
VTVHDRGMCPESVNCGTRDTQGFSPPGTTIFASSANPLVSRDYYYCNGSFTQNYVVGIEVWLTDAKGHRTPVVRTFWVCQTH